MSVDRFGKKYNRLYSTVVTPFMEDYQVDEPALRKFLQYFMQPKFLDAGGGIIINPACGEIFYLSREEKKRNRGSNLNYLLRFASGVVRTR